MFQFTEPLGEISVSKVCLHVMTVVANSLERQIESRRLITGRWNPVIRHVLTRMPTCAATVPKWCRLALNIGLLNQQVWRLPASAHDARLLVEAGYQPASVEVLDLSTHTHHVEVVSSLERAN
jgi:hypothetical protein